MYESRIKSELQNKYDSKEMEKMWKQLSSLVWLMFSLEVFMYSWGTPIFYLVGVIAVSIISYKLIWK